MDLLASLPFELEQLVVVEGGILLEQLDMVGGVGEVHAGVAQLKQLAVRVHQEALIDAIAVKYQLLQINVLLLGNMIIFLVYKPAI